MGRLKCDHIKRLITLTSDNIKRLSLYSNGLVLITVSNFFNNRCLQRILKVSSYSFKFCKCESFKKTPFITSLKLLWYFETIFNGNKVTHKSTYLKSNERFFKSKFQNYKLIICNKTA